jgi:transposase
MIPASVRIWLYNEPVDMRRGFDGLALIARQRMEQDPQSGAMFVFVNRRMTRLKALWFDRNGYCILYKRLHRAVLRLPRGPGAEGVASRIDGVALAKLLEGVPTAQRERMMRLAS